MEWDDENLDDEGLDDERIPPLLPPDDRLWRHPSEVAGTVAGPVAPVVPLPVGAPARGPRLLTVVALTSSISAIVTLAAIAAIRPVRTEVAVERVAQPAVTMASAPGAPGDYSAIAERLRPSIVQILTESPEGSGRGSGVVVRSDGLLLTTHHLVERARTVQFLLHDGTEVGVRFVGADPETDLAVFDLDGDSFEPAPLGSAIRLKVGQPVVTIGSPTNGSAGPVVSVSTVSAIGQVAETAAGRLVDLVQTDGAVPPGCRGGAVVDASGAVVGIAVADPKSEVVSFGYATPIDVARLVADQLETHGRVRRAWLGIDGEDLPAARAKQLGTTGVVVRSVAEASPAAQAGVRAADVIAELAGRRVPSMPALVVELRSRQPGETVTLTLVRDGKKRTVDVTLAEKTAS